MYSDDLLIRAPNSPKISLIRTKSAGTDFLFWTDERFSNPENSLIRIYQPGTKVSGLSNHHCYTSDHVVQHNTFLLVSQNYK